MLVRALPSGAVDVVGDVHGWLEPLRALLARLGYDREGRHPEGRQLVFVGDLVDRGPASLEVWRLVRGLVDAGRAGFVLGNHELNLLVRQGPRQAHGNAWFFALPAAVQGEIREWLDRQALAFYREDLRVVHACWQAEAVDALAQRAEASVVAAWAEYRSRLEPLLAAEEDPVRRDLLRQNRNPVKVLTSGLEVAAPRPYEAGGRQRRTARDPWWERYRDRAAVVFGHYWRSLSGRPVHQAGFRYLFPGQAPLAPLGPVGRAWCIDYSIAVGPQEGAGLAALRWPEAELVLA